MKKYTMDDFITDKLAVRVNEDNVMDFLKMCEEKGLIWQSGEKATEYHSPDIAAISCGYFSNNRLTFTSTDESEYYSDNGYTVVDFSQIIKPIRYQIIIEADGDTTTAKMVVNGKEVKQAAAKRNPADKANWRTGAQVAFDRLWQKQPKPEKPAENGGFKVGDRVVCTTPCFECSGKHGRIVVVEKGRGCNIGVEFDEDFPHSHSCSGKIKSGRGYWLFADVLSHEQPTKQKVKEVKRQAKPGEYIKLTKELYSFDRVGLILRVDRVGSCAMVLDKNHPTSYTDAHTDPEFLWAYPNHTYVVLEGYKP